MSFEHGNSEIDSEKLLLWQVTCAFEKVKIISGSIKRLGFKINQESGKKYQIGK